MFLPNSLVFYYTKAVDYDSQCYYQPYIEKEDFVTDGIISHLNEVILLSTWIYWYDHKVDFLTGKSKTRNAGRPIWVKRKER